MAIGSRIIFAPSGHYLIRRLRNVEYYILAPAQSRRNLQHPLKNRPLPSAGRASTHAVRLQNLRLGPCGNAIILFLGNFWAKIAVRRCVLRLSSEDAIEPRRTAGVCVKKNAMTIGIRGVRRKADPARRVGYVGCGLEDAGLTGSDAALNVQALGIQRSLQTWRRQRDGNVGHGARHRTKCVADDDVVGAAVGRRDV